MLLDPSCEYDPAIVTETCFVIKNISSVKNYYLLASLSIQNWTKNIEF